VSRSDAVAIQTHTHKALKAQWLLYVTPVSVSAGARDLSRLQNVETGFGAHPVSSSVCSGVICWGGGGGVKRPGSQVDRSLPASSGVRNEWSCTSARPICFHGVDGNNFTFFTTCLNIKTLHFTYRLWLSQPTANICLKGVGQLVLVMGMQFFPWNGDRTFLRNLGNSHHTTYSLPREP
jgi:hypothetical protein